MLKCFITFILFGAMLVNGIHLVKPGSKITPTKGELWPKPQYQKKENNYYTLRPPNFKVKILNNTCDILNNAVHRYSFFLRIVNNLNRFAPETSSRRRRRNLATNKIKHDPNYKGRMLEFNIDLTSPCENYPYFGMDESYDLVVAANSKLTSNSIWGILRGLETFSQLIYITDDYSAVLMNKTHISDFPRYSHRGLMIDTSRHYVTLGQIKKTIDAMGMNKLNVFHWHIVDDQSFPYQSEAYPELARKGAYFYPTMTYTKEDIQLIIEYAKDRGIRVVPEFDVPGHTASWGVAHPNILTECYNNNKVIGLGPMDPIKNETYDLLGRLINEVQARFPDKYFHIGGDEVELDCWKSNPRLKKYMKDHHLTTSELHGLFMERVLPLLGHRSKAIVWQEVFDEGVPLSKDTLIQVWKWDWVNDMIKILQSGHRLLFSSSWYLDHLKTGGDWIDYYTADPREMVSSKNGNLTNLENIVGGEACMWGEVVDDSNIISRVWPRASAVAERLWSPAMDSENYSDQLTDAKQRIEEHTCRMLRRGIRAQPPNGPGFCVGIP